MTTSGERVATGSGVLSVVSAPANPAVGADWVTNPPSLRQIVSVAATLTTSVTAANRLPNLQIKDNAGHTLVSLPASSVQAASLVEQYVWGVNLPFASGNNLNLVPIPTGIVLAPTWSLGTSTTLLQAGDQWSAIVITYAG